MQYKDVGTMIKISPAFWILDMAQDTINTMLLLTNRLSVGNKEQT